MFVIIFIFKNQQRLWR